MELALDNRSSTSVRDCLSGPSRWISSKLSSVGLAGSPTKALYFPAYIKCRFGSFLETGGSSEVLIAGKNRDSLQLSTESIIFFEYAINHSPALNFLVPPNAPGKCNKYLITRLAFNAFFLQPNVYQLVPEKLWGCLIQGRQD